MTIERFRIDTSDRTNYKDIRFQSLRPYMYEYQFAIIDGNVVFIPVQPEEGEEFPDYVPAKLGHSYYYVKDAQVMNYDNVLYEIPMQRKLGDVIELSIYSLLAEGWYTISDWVTNQYYPTIDFSDFMDKQYPWAVEWRLREVVYEINYLYGLVGSRTEEEEYYLLDLPWNWTTGYYYDGFMELQLYVYYG